MKKLLAAWMAALVLVAIAYGAFATRTGQWRALWRVADLQSLTPEIGLAFTAKTGHPELSSHESPSPAQMLEDGRPLGPANAQHADIRQLGHGRFSFWHDYVYFSSSDGSDPRANGRAYGFTYPPITQVVARTIYGLAGAATLVALLMTMLVLRPLIAALADPARRRPAQERVLSAIVTAGEWLGIGRPKRALAVLWVVAVALLVASDAAHLMRTGGWTGLWPERPLTDIRPELGHAYIARTGDLGLSSHQDPSPAGVLEDGRRLRLGNALHADIRQFGRGQYSFWYDYVYLSSSDNTDPRTNGRRYAIVYPPITHAQAQILYVATGIVWIGVLLWSFVVASRLAIAAGGVAVSHVAGIERERFVVAARQAATLVVAASVVAIVAPAALRASASSWAVADVVWPWAIALNVAAAVICLYRYGRRPPGRLLAVYIGAVAIALFLLMGFAPHRPEGCHTAAPVSAWAGFCVSPDSSSYYMPWAPGSPRQPLYSWFIRVATLGTGFDWRAFMATTVPGALITDPHAPLFRVVHLQILLLALAALAACWQLSRFLGSAIPAIAFVWMYDAQYFTAIELNDVLTETLVMAITFLLVAVFFAFLRRPRERTLLAAAALCGLVYLTRQAAGYTLLILAVMMLVGLAMDRRAYLKAGVASLTIAGALFVIPDLYAFAATGHLAKQQESLQYQYRIAQAMQYATAADADLMPDAGTRAWLLDAVRRRDAAHRAVEAKYPGGYDRMVYYINANLYEVATPPGAPQTPQFYMTVATPVLMRHWKEYARFAFRFWAYGLTYPGLARLGGWTTYLLLAVGIIWLRNRAALAAATLVLSHWSAVALAAMFAAPIARMVWATEFLVIIAGVVVFWALVDRLASVLAARRVAGEVAL